MGNTCQKCGLDKGREAQRTEEITIKSSQEIKEEE